MSYVLAFLGFAVLIILHEAGHFVAAKAVGMRVERFSLFFGPMLIKRTWGETVYGIGVVPLGGYVKITGMTPDDTFLPIESPAVAGAATAGRPMPVAAMSSGGATSAVLTPPAAVSDVRQQDPRAYLNQPVWKRIVVIAAGPFVNLVIAFVLLWAIVLSTGVYVNDGFAVAKTDAGSPAAGVLAAGDVIVSVDGARTEAGIERAIAQTRCRGTQTNGCTTYPAVRIVVERSGHRRALTVNARYSAAAGKPIVGFEYGVNQVHRTVGAVSAVGWSVRGMGEEIGSTFSALGHIFETKERKQLHSIVGVYKVEQQSISSDPSQGLEILAVVSLALAVFNLLPFLPLDGGHIFWAVAEKLRGGRQISLQTMTRASVVGIALMLALFVIGFSNDISTITSGGFHVH